MHLAVWSRYAWVVGAGLCLRAPVARAQQAPSFESDFCKRRGANVDWDKIKRELGRPVMSLGARLLRELAADADEKRLAFSPYSISAALTLTMVGARGTTASELAEGLGRGGVPTGATLLLEEQLVRHLGCARPYGTTIGIANRIFLQKGKTLVPEYLKTMRDNFDATVGEVDYKKAAEPARQEINDWVARHTYRKIVDLLGPRALTAETKLTLVNALYLKGRWGQGFPKGETKPRDFKLAAKKTIQVPTMATKGLPASFQYAERKERGYRAVALRLDDHFGRFVVLLPDKVDGLADLVKALDAAEVDQLLAALAGRTVKLTLPKFKAESSFDLKAALTGLGIKAAFDAKKADFSGIDLGRDQLYVGVVAHKAFVEIDEDGIEGAAATAVGMAAGGKPPQPTDPVTFKVDHPFAYLVLDDASRVVLFQGVVRDPR